MKILVPLDGTPLAESVLPHIGDLVKAPAEAVLVRVSPPILNEAHSEGDRVVPTWEQRLGIETRYRRYLESIGKEKLGDGFEIIAEVVFGKPAEEILRTAREHRVDLIAMATHGRHGVSRLVHGSVAAHILEESEIPVVLFMAPKHQTHSVSREAAE
ncbi:MAG: universal stress protein [Chloroflexota bacterium]|nr:MAG: universal stress protein [Chloroflexota bacterium]